MKIAYRTLLGDDGWWVEFLCKINKRIHGKRFFLQSHGMSCQTWVSDVRAKELLSGPFPIAMTKITEPFQFDIKSNKWVCKSCMREFDIVGDGIGPNSTCPGEDCPSKWEEVGKTHPDISASVHISFSS